MKDHLLVLPGATGPASPSVVDRSGEKLGGWDEDARPSTGKTTFAHSRELSLFFVLFMWTASSRAGRCKGGRPGAVLAVRPIFPLFVSLLLKSRLHNKKYFKEEATTSNRGQTPPPIFTRW